MKPWGPGQSETLWITNHSDPGPEFSPRLLNFTNVSRATHLTLGSSSLKHVPTETRRSHFQAPDIVHPFDARILGGATVTATSQLSQLGRGASFYAGKMHDGWLKTHLHFIQHRCALLATFFFFCPGFCGDKYDVRHNVLPFHGPTLVSIDIFYLQLAFYLWDSEVNTKGVWFQQSTATVDHACRRLDPWPGSQPLCRRSTGVHSLEWRPL